MDFPLRCFHEICGILFYVTYSLQILHNGMQYEFMPGRSIFAYATAVFVIKQLLFLYNLGHDHTTI